MDSVLVYPGGKATIASWICENLPGHSIWCDVFGGGGSISFYKDISEVEVYNDIGYVSLFFSILRNEESGPKLLEKLYMTPMSEDEFHYCRVRLKFETDPIEQARMWYVQTLMCFTHEISATGWIGVGKKVSQAKSFRNHVDSIPAAVNRMRSWNITNRHFRDIIQMYDDKSTLFYCDPPYLNEDGSQVTVGYEDKMSHAEHAELIYLLKTCKGQAMISGYTNSLYEKELADWEHKELTRKVGVKNNEHERLGITTNRTEHLWIKRHAEPFKTKKVQTVKYEPNSLWTWEEELKDRTPALIS